MFNEDGTETTGGIGDFVRKINDANLWAKITKKYEGQIKGFIQTYESHIITITDYRVTAPYAAVLEAAKEYVQSLCTSFELF
jgi:hypothetical protein